MKMFTAFVAAVGATVSMGTGVLAAGPAPLAVSVLATTCVSVGATWVDNQQVAPSMTVCLPTP